MDKHLKGKNSHKNPEKILKIALIIAGCYIISIFIPYIASYTKYPLYIIKCGGMPITASKFMGSWSYNLPGESSYGVSPVTSDLFCSEKDARAAHYQH